MAFSQTLDFAVQLFQPVIQKRSTLIKVQGHFQQAVKFLLGLLQLLLQIGLCAVAGLDVTQDAVDLGSNFIGEVCRQTLYRFQNGAVQFFSSGWTASCRRISFRTRCDLRTARRFAFCRGYSKSSACRGCRSHRRTVARTRHTCCYSGPGGACVDWQLTCCFGGQSQFAPLGTSVY